MPAPAVTVVIPAYDVADTNRENIVAPMAEKPQVPAGPLVSVVITTFNHARFLADAISSARSQTRPAEEIIVVDDGSTDNPAAVVADFPGVHLIRQLHHGLAAARNTGWRATQGKYVVFLDADDLLLADAIGSNLRRFDRNPDCAFVYGAYRIVDGEGRLLYLPTPNAIGGDPYATFLGGNSIGMHATVMYRREILQEAGGFDSHLRACEDYDLYLRLAQRYKVASGDERIADYRRHDSNMSGNVGMMLTTVLGVLRRHRRNALTRRRWRAAYRVGVRNWKSYYVGNQIRRAGASMIASGYGHMPLRAIARMFILAPAAASRAVFSGVGKFVRSRLARGAGNALDLGDLHRLSPISKQFGFERGKPVDRRYIESFLADCAGDMRGRVLETGDNAYTLQFGQARVTQSDVLHVSEENPLATFHGDLANGNNLPSDAFDCVVLTQTLHLVFDMRKAIATLYRILKPDGVLLVTVPGVSSVDRGQWGKTWYWSLTEAALRGLLEEQFDAIDVSLIGYGNVLTAIAFLHGLAERDLLPTEFEACDPHYPVIVAARAVKRGGRPDAGAATA